MARGFRGELPGKERSRICRKALDYIRANPMSQPSRGATQPMTLETPCPERATPGGAAPAVVLDTNAVLDWLVFRDPSCAAWTDRFADGRVRWIASTAMRVELAHVLARPALAPWRPEPQAVWAAWERWARMLEPVAPAGPAARLRCTDPDDQKFVDLALARGARWLVSRDRAVLKLGRRTRSLGLQVLTPGSWAAALPAG